MNRENIDKIAHSSEDRLLLAKLWDKINTAIQRSIPASTCFLSPRELEMARLNIDKIAHSSEDRLLLAKLWDKINTAIQRSIPASTCFLSPRELEMARFLFGQEPGLHAFGGYAQAERRMLVYLPEYLEESSLFDEDSPCVCLRAAFYQQEPGLHAFGGYAQAERRMLVYLPEYLEESSLFDEDSPCVCLRAAFYQGDSPSHRDFLGALMGCGIGRETLGDLLVGKESCDFFVTAQIAPYILQNFTSAGRAKVRMQQISLTQVQVPDPEIRLIRDTLPSLRLDSVISSGFRIGRSLASQYVTAGKAAVDGLPVEKPDWHPSMSPPEKPPWTASRWRSRISC